MNRRSFLQSILAAGVAPAVIGSGILMPVRKLWTPPLVINLGPSYLTFDHEDFVSRYMRVVAEHLANRIDSDMLDLYSGEQWTEQQTLRLT
jgi:hypothetical protein